MDIVLLVGMYIGAGILMLAATLITSACIVSMLLSEAEGKYISPLYLIKISLPRGRSNDRG